MPCHTASTIDITAKFVAIFTLQICDVFCVLNFRFVKDTSWLPDGTVIAAEKEESLICLRASVFGVVWLQSGDAGDAGDAADWSVDSSDGRSARRVTYERRHLSPSPPPRTSWFTWPQCGRQWSSSGFRIKATNSRNGRDGSRWHQNVFCRTWAWPNWCPRGTQSHWQ